MYDCFTIMHGRRGEEKDKGAVLAQNILTKIHLFLLHKLNDCVKLVADSIRKIRETIPAI